MTNSTKKKIVALAATGALLTGGFFLAVRKSESPQICFQGRCERVTAAQYNAIKHGLADKFESAESVTWQEYAVFTAILNAEIKESDGKLTMTDVHSKADLRKKIASFLKETR